MDEWLLKNLVCPRHRVSLKLESRTLSCIYGCSFPVIDDIPIMLLANENQTIDLARETMNAESKDGGDDDLYLESLGVSASEREGILKLVRQQNCAIDPVVSYLVGATNGIAYKSLIGVIDRYPIPELRLPEGQGARFLDIGCSWGRWSLAAARKGYQPVGIDPSLGAVMAARRVAKQLGLKASFIVGDARFLPIRSESIDQVFSYSVIQHFSRLDAAAAVKEIGRVLNDTGRSLVQMPTKYGLRCLYHQARRGFSDGDGFAVRYWTVPALRRMFSDSIGPTEVSVDCFFGIGLQKSDASMMPTHLKLVIGASELLRETSQVITPLVYTADSIYLANRKRPQQH